MCVSAGLLEHRHRSAVIFEFVAAVVGLQRREGNDAVLAVMQPAQHVIGVVIDLFTLHQHKWALYHALLDVSTSPSPPRCPCVITSSLCFQVIALPTRPLCVGVDDCGEPSMVWTGGA